MMTTFSDGQAEEIINFLARIPGPKVIARNSSFAFRGNEHDITKIADHSASRPSSRAACAAREVASALSAAA
ncbi:MAG: hypothetical protein ABSB35_16995 [Bryobacteraceae bacterium]|jgi:TolB-like protein